MWILKNQKLYRRFVFSDFRTAFAFMQQVAEAAEVQQHHPTWTNTYNSVEIWLCTHDAGNIVTAKDYALAEAIDTIWERWFESIPKSDKIQ